MRDEFYFPSKDGNTEIHTIEWKPEGEVKAVLQICHGMVEYIKRYSYTSAEDDEEISERSVFYARTQYGVFAFASVYSDVRQGIERGDHYGRGCRS